MNSAALINEPADVALDLQVLENLAKEAAKVLTQSGRAMIEALIGGERDSAALAALAELARGKLRPKIRS